MMSKEAKEAYCKGYERGRKDLVLIMEWLHRWYDEHPNSSYEEAEAAFLTAPIEEIFPA